MYRKQLLKRTGLIFIWLFLCLRMQAQEHFSASTIPTKGGEVFYQKIDTNGIRSTTLFKASEKFFISYFTDSDCGIQYRDSIEGKIIAKGKIRFYVRDFLNGKWYYNVDFLSEVTVKNGRYRIRLYNYNIKTLNLSNWPVGTNGDWAAISFPFLIKKCEKNKKRYLAALEKLNTISLAIIKDYDASVKGSKSDDF